MRDAADALLQQITGLAESSGVTKYATTQAQVNAMHRHSLLAPIVLSTGTITTRTANNSTTWFLDRGYARAIRPPPTTKSTAKGAM